MELIPVIVFFIPILAIFMTFGTAMLGIYLSYRKRREMFTLYHQERMAAIEKGVDLPPLPDHFFGDDSRPGRRSSHGSLLTGLIMLFVGATLYVSLHFAIPRNDQVGDVALFALIPTGIGVAFLLYYAAVGRKLALELEQERKAARQSPPPVA
ncbi:MAG TPA: DUF6249 domain-containing protein [Verrucomicrobiae bacterium]|jgi:hypothetical protein|nr:DUF6249 domain-containing protein [Verrucomicrobiae bacterium]